MKRLPGWIFFFYLCWLLTAVSFPIVADTLPKQKPLVEYNCPDPQIIHGVDGSLRTYYRIRETCTGYEGPKIYAYKKK